MSHEKTSVHTIMTGYCGSVVVLRLVPVSLNLSGGFTACRHLRLSSGREHAVI